MRPLEQRNVQSRHLDSNRYQSLETNINRQTLRRLDRELRRLETPSNLSLSASQHQPLVVELSKTAIISDLE